MRTNRRSLKWKETSCQEVSHSYVDILKKALGLDVEKVVLSEMKVGFRTGRPFQIKVVVAVVFSDDAQIQNVVERDQIMEISFS